jgi:hypothetical protein
VRDLAGNYCRITSRRSTAHSCDVTAIVEKTRSRGRFEIVGRLGVPDEELIDRLGVSSSENSRAEVQNVHEDNSAIYDGTFSTPKTEAGSRQVPLSVTALRIVGEWKAHVTKTGPEALVFATQLGTPLSPNNVLRRSIFPACDQLGFPPESNLRCAPDLPHAARAERALDLVGVQPRAWAEGHAVEWRDYMSCPEQ